MMLNNLLSFSVPAMAAALIAAAWSFPTSAAVHAEPSAQELETTAGEVVETADKVKPLPVGASAPTTVLKDAAGKTVKLAELYADGPVVLVFFRGGWCPFCSVHLGELQKIQGELHELGVTMAGISPDTPEFTEQGLHEMELTYLLLSDASAEATIGFGLAFRVDDETVSQYKDFGFDLEERSGQAHHILPVPGVFVVGRDGVIRFAHWDPDYKKRIDNESLLQAVRLAKQPEQGAP